MAVIAPVLIMMTSRSGSSMVTQIFAEHGLWIGRKERENRFGYRHFENVDLREHLAAQVERGEYPGGMKHFLHGRSLQTVRDVIESIVPADTPWVYKTGIDSLCMFDGLYPDTKWVFVKRRVAGVVASNGSKSGNAHSHIRPIVEARYQVMDKLAKDRGIPYVYTDELIAGDYSSLEVAMRHCGIAFQPDIANRVIDPEKWRH